MKLVDSRAVFVFMSLCLTLACSSASKPSADAAAPSDAARERGTDATGSDAPGADAPDALATDGSAADRPAADGPTADRPAADGPTADVPAADAATPDGARGDAPEVGTAVYSGFTLVLDEEFDEPLDLDHDPLWTWGDGAPQPGLTRFVKEGLSFSDGKLVITEVPAATPIAGSSSYSQPAMNMTTGLISSTPNASGELRTRYNNYRFGRYEARVTFTAPGSPSGRERLGVFSVDRQPQWQQWNEIDLKILSNLPHSIVTTVVNLHDTTFFLAELNAAQTVGPAFKQSETHDYAFTWLPDRIDWSVDGAVVKSASGTELVVSNQSAKIRLNAWTADFPALDFTVYPVTMAVDYVRFYKWDQDTTYPCAPTPACLPNDDRDFARNNANDPAGP